MARRARHAQPGRSQPRLLNGGAAQLWVGVVCVWECTALWCDFTLAVLMAWVGFFFLWCRVAASAPAAGSARPIVANRVLRLRITATLQGMVIGFRRIAQAARER